MAKGDPYELVKIVCQPVSIHRDGDRVVGEVVGPAQPCYSAEELAAYFESCQAEIAARNIEARAAKRSRRG